jgi:hypothetical protein
MKKRGIMRETSPLVPTPNPCDPTTIDIRVFGCQKGDSGIGFSERWARSQDYSHESSHDLEKRIDTVEKDRARNMECQIRHDDCHTRTNICRPRACILGAKVLNCPPIS